jgi:hypothetical protein
MLGRDLRILTYIAIGLYFARKICARALPDGNTMFHVFVNSGYGFSIRIVSGKDIKKLEAIKRYMVVFFGYGPDYISVSQTPKYKIVERDSDDVVYYYSGDDINEFEEAELVYQMHTSSEIEEFCDEKEG